MQKNITKSELFTAYNIARAALRKSGDTKAIERLNKALGILQSKATDPNGYDPRPESCGCKDWEYRHAAKRAYTGPCKHMIAESMVIVIEQARADHNVTALFEHIAAQRDNAEV